MNIIGSKYCWTGKGFRTMKRLAREETRDGKPGKIHPFRQRRRPTNSEKLCWIRTLSERANKEKKGEKKR